MVGSKTLAHIEYAPLVAYQPFRLWQQGILASCKDDINHGIAMFVWKKVDYYHSAGLWLIKLILP